MGEGGRLSLRKRPPSSSSFHEYNPERRVPLKERLKAEEEEMKLNMSNVGKESNAGEVGKDASVGDVGKDSLRSRFLRRFGLGTDDRMADIKEKDEAKTRKKSDEFFSFKGKEETKTR